MRLIERNVVVRHEPGRAPLCGFITYIHPTEPVLLRRTGWEIGDDIHDDFSDTISHDNGRTWSKLGVAFSKTPSGNGFITHTENAVVYVPDRNELIHFTNDKFDPGLEMCDLNYPYSTRITVGEPAAVSGGTAASLASDFGFSQGMCVSFSTPVIDSRGRILAPLQWQRQDNDGSIRAQGFVGRQDMPDVMLDVWDVGLLIGELQQDNSWNWRMGSAVPGPFEASSRGLCEGSVAELADGRLVMVLRGSNAGWPDRANYKWLSFSDDGGDTWSIIEPLRCDDGALLESSATGSALFRSINDNKLYWIGNICAHGEHAVGNFPRSPLYLCEVQEEPFALKRSTLLPFADRAPHEDPQVQHSNFKFYQDRATGHVIVYLTRYSERGSAGLDWKKADLYEYRVGLD